MLLRLTANQRHRRKPGRAHVLMLDDPRAPGGYHLWSIFERDAPLSAQTATDISARLLIAGSNDVGPWLVTPPDHPLSASSTPRTQHAPRPRRASGGLILDACRHNRSTRGLSPCDRRVGNAWKVAFGERAIVDAGWSRRLSCIILRDN